MHHNVKIIYVAGNIYPVGSIYMSCSNTNPSVIFGFGTWELIKDTFLLGAGDIYEVGSTGGEATHKLTKAELPKHEHYLTSGTGSGNTYSDLYNPGSGVGASSYDGNNVLWTNEKLSWVETGLKDEPHNNMPPYLAVYIWKRVS